MNNEMYRSLFVIACVGLAFFGGRMTVSKTSGDSFEGKKPVAIVSAPKPIAKAGKQAGSVPGDIQPVAKSRPITLGEIFAGGPSSDKLVACIELVSKCHVHELPDVIEKLRSEWVDGRCSRALLTACCEVAAGRDTNTGRKLMEDSSFARANPEGARAVLTAWAGKFPQDALKWASAKAPENVFALPGDDLKALARGLSDADPALFTDFLKTAPPGSEFVTAGLGAYVSAGKIGIKSTYADLWANLNDGKTPDLRNSVSFKIGMLAAGTNLESIANLADQAVSLPPVSGDPFSSSAVISAYAQTDPGAALAWATKLPTGNPRNSALSSGVGRLAMVDPDAALQYVRDFPGGSTVERMNLISGIKNGAKQNPKLPPEEKAELMEQADVLLSQLKSELRSQQR